MAGLQLSGLASGLDWKTLVDQLMELERTPINRIEREKTTNTQRSTALRDLNTKLSALQTAAQALADSSIFSARKASSDNSSSTWRISASAGAAVGSHVINVTQLATKARREGAADITSGINATADVSALTLATMRTAAPPTAGTFTINGAQVTVSTTDTLQDVFDAISTATGGDVTAAYNPATDKITLTKGTAGEIVLGAANDTSNLLAVLKLANNGTGTVTSYGTLGAARTGDAVINAGLRTTVTAVDGSGNGSFSINGVTISYNVNDDSLNTILKRINASGAGVTASYDATNDRVVLTNKATGDLGITLSEAAGGLLGALGLTSGYTTVRGDNAEFSVDGGDTLISTSNTLDASVHGISGLSLTVNSTTSETVTVEADTDTMRAKIDAFISAYNAVGAYIDEKTRITTSNGKVTASVLSTNREVQAWQSQLRNLAFSSVTGLGGTVDQLDDLGISFDRDGRMSVSDASKLSKALTETPLDVEEFFSNPTLGLAAKFDSLLDNMIDSADDAQERLSKTNNDLDRQIADLERRLEQQRELLTNSFIAMETQQSRIQQQSAALTRAFSTNSSSS